MRPLLDKEKYIVITFLFIILCLLVFYNKRKTIEHLDPVTTEAVKNMASVFNQDKMIVKKLQTTDTLTVGTDATVAKTLTAKDLVVNNNAYVKNNLEVSGQILTTRIIVNNDFKTKDIKLEKCPFPSYYDAGVLKTTVEDLYTATNWQTPVYVSISWERNGKVVTLSIPEFDGFCKSGVPVYISLNGLPFKPQYNGLNFMITGAHNGRPGVETCFASYLKNANKFLFKFYPPNGPEAKEYPGKHFRIRACTLSWITE